MVAFGGNTWLGGGCVFGGAPSLAETLLPRVLDAFGRGHYSRDPDGLHVQDALVTAHAAQRSLLAVELAAAQIHPRTTTVWLPTAESLWALPLAEGLTGEGRRRRLAAWRRPGSGRRADILGALREIAPAAELVTTSAAVAQGDGFARGVFQGAVLLGDSFYDAQITRDVYGLLVRLTAARTVWHTARRRGFRCAFRGGAPADDLCDVDVLGH